MVDWTWFPTYNWGFTCCTSLLVCIDHNKEAQKWKNSAMNITLILHFLWIDFMIFGLLCALPPIIDMMIKKSEQCIDLLQGGVSEVSKKIGKGKSVYTLGAYTPLLWTLLKHRYHAGRKKMTNCLSKWRSNFINNDSHLPYLTKYLVKKIDS